MACESSNVGGHALRVIVVCLHGEGADAFPTVLPRLIMLAPDTEFPPARASRRKSKWNPAAVVLPGGVGVSLDHQESASRWPVDPKSDLTLMSGVILRLA